MDKNGGEVIAKMIGVLFMSRTASHMAHLFTPSYSKHMALAEFYDEVIDLADTLAESAQGKFGKLEIPFMDLKGDIKTPIELLETHVMMIENLQKRCEYSWLDNIVQEIVALYMQTIYKMKELG